MEECKKHDVQNRGILYVMFFHFGGNLQEFRSMFLKPIIICNYYKLIFIIGNYLLMPIKLTKQKTSKE